MSILYVRFVLPATHHQTHRACGLFQVAWAVHRRRRARIAPSRLDRHIAWFNEHLIAPHFEVQDSRAVFWFRNDAGESLRRARCLATWLRTRGLRVTTLQTGDPGNIIYRDFHQVAAVPRTSECWLI